MTSYFSVHVQHRDIALLNCNDHILIWNFYFHQFIIHFIIYYLVFSPVSKIWHPHNSTNSLHLSFKYKVINPWWCFFESVFFFPYFINITTNELSLFATKWKMYFISLKWEIVSFHWEMWILSSHGAIGTLR